MSIALRRVAVAGLVSLAIALSGGRAQAAGPEEPADDGSSGGNVAKGIVGGAILGAELVMLGESAFRLRPGWMYLVGGGAGALAGGYLGYRIGDGSSNKPPAFLLAGGIALVIPTIMGVLTATQYAPPEPLGEPDEEDENEDALEEDAISLRLELPNVGLAQAFSREQLALVRLPRVTELHLSLLRGVF
jgi:hypothetical protein